MVLSTHLISDIEKILDDIIFLKDGQVILAKTVDEVRDESGKSIDSLFRSVQMLGKLLKYEIKATSRWFLPLYVAIIFSAIINKFLFVTL